MGELLRSIFGELLRHVLGDRVIFALMRLALAAWFAHSGWAEWRRRRLVYAAVLLPMGLVIGAATCFLAFSD